MDMFPTTLAALGVSIEGDRLGLGTNLFSSKKTIPEEIGLDNFNKELKKSSDYYYKYISNLSRNTMKCNNYIYHIYIGTRWEQI